MNQSASAPELARTDVAAACDLIIGRAIAMMHEECKAERELIIDRLLTIAGAMMTEAHGAPRAASIFRQMAGNIEGGCFASVVGDQSPPVIKH